MILKLDEDSSISEIRYKILVMVMLGWIVGPTDYSIVNVILPNIAKYFGVSISAISVCSSDLPFLLLATHFYFIAV